MVEYFYMSLTSNTENKYDGAYTRILRASLNKSWSVHVTNK